MFLKCFFRFCLFENSTASLHHSINQITIRLSYPLLLKLLKALMLVDDFSRPVDHDIFDLIITQKDIVMAAGAIGGLTSGRAVHDCLDMVESTSKLF